MMKRHHNGDRFSFNLSFIDMLFNILLGFAMLFFLALILANKPTQDKKIDSKAEIMIVMTWPNESSDDVDLWVLSPELNKIGFKSRENGYINLDRDDLGMSNDYVTDEKGKRKLILLNKEVTSIRAMKNGHYVVNVSLYDRHPNPLKGGTVDMDPIPVTVELIQLNPNVRTVYRVQVMLDVRREEKTAFSFDIINQNTIVGISSVQYSFIYNDFGHPEQLSEPIP